MVNCFRDVFFLALAFMCFCMNSSSALNVSYDGRAIIIDGERRILISGSIHYPRSTSEMWKDLIQKAKDGGLDAIETYMFWNVHEPRRREYNFEGNLDFIKFIRTVQEAGMYAVLRIGPYVCAEWNYGGFPVWLHQIPGIEFRTDNQIFKDEMQTFTTLIVNMVKKENLFASQGGPIILAQIENEYGNIMQSYGDHARPYIEWCAKMAESLDIGIPWIMCQQWDAPPPMINTCNGFYCHRFQPNKPNIPKMWTENWTGWFHAWGHSDQHRLAEDLAYAVARFFESGGTFQNYYMYHGGTNFGRTSGGPYISTSYDYDAPLDEYGNLRQPKWGHLKQLHAALKMMEKTLAYGDANVTFFEDGASVTKYAVKENTASCFLVNRNTSKDAKITFEGNQYIVPAWSVSILPDCKNEVYNTAKVNTQTSLMVKQNTGTQGQPAKFSWQWRPEAIKDALNGQGSFSRNQLLEQINVTGDESDYLWYMTSLEQTSQNPSWRKQMALRIKTMGHVLHVFFNRHLVGSYYSTTGNYQSVFEQEVHVKPNKNTITLLSATVGLANYGARFELQTAGIVGGPVELIGSGNTTIDLSSATWSYKIGLNGERKKMYLASPPHKVAWLSDSLVTNKNMVWYKTTFEVPPGEDPLVLDMQGMGKGQAWVNGQGIGRYWPSFISADTNCKPCEYRQQFQDGQCLTNCGQPSQRWYHVPRSFTTKGQNTLILFEEVGGDPSNVTIQTVVVGTVCANAIEGSKLELSCQGSREFKEFQFASFGDPSGTCGSFQKGSCEAPDTLAAVKKACIGCSSCTIDVIETTFGSSGCGGDINKRLAVQAVC